MPSKTKAPARNQEFDLVFAALRTILKPYDKRLRVTKDLPVAYMSESKSLRYRGNPVMFASLASKSYVSLHLFPVYIFPDLVKDISPELKKRMQGMTCWNFKKIEEPLFAELQGVVDAAWRRFAEFGDRDLSREDALALWGKAKT